MKVGSTDQPSAAVDSRPNISIQPLERSLLLNIILAIIIISTGGLFFLFYHWFIKVKSLFFFRSDLNNCTHLRVIRKDSPSEICEVRDIEISQQAINPDWPEAKKRYRVIRYNFEYFILSEELNTFVPLVFNSNLKFPQFHQGIRGIESDKLIKDRQSAFGKSVIDVPVPSYFELSVLIVLRPFFVFQIFSIILWCTEQYYWYSICIFVVMVTTLIVNVYYQRYNLLEIQKLATYVCKVTVLREGVKVIISSEDLVPGDIIFLEERLLFPCDCILLSGFALMNEMMLTGESQPVLKESLPNINSVYNKDKLYTLSAGTEVVATGSTENLAYVITTGYSTSKGELVRSIMFPKPARFKFERDAMLFVLILFGISMIGFLISIEPLRLGGYESGDIAIKLLDLITIAVPPALPLTMYIGVGYSVGRLKSKKISCISQPAINAAGRVSVICFDKTGTITTDSMRLKGVYEVSSSEAIEDFSHLSVLMQKCIAVCNSLTVHVGQLLGDPQEIAMFKAIGWRAETNTHGKLVSQSPDGSMIVTSRFSYNFSPEIKRMGVIVEEKGEFYLFMKGAPEVILPLCEEVPEQLYQIFIGYTRLGYRVLACGYKKLKSFNENDVLLDIEKPLILLGFPYLENPLKDESISVLDKLHKARIHTTISTGDNILTALAVGKCLKMIRDEIVFFGDYIGNEEIWKDSDGRRVPELSDKEDYGLVITGSLLEQIVTNEPERIETIKQKCRIFGRMAPKHKIMLIESFQKEDTMVGMVGDGANDCGALKQADVGLSLSEAEASIAAPFSSKDLASIIYVLREGRCALASSYQCFKFMMIYSIIQFTCVIMLYWKQTNLTNNQFIYQDFFNVMPCVCTVAASLPYKRLSKRLPPGSLLSFQILVSVIGVAFIVVGLMVGSIGLMKTSFSWYTEPDIYNFDPEDINRTDSGYIGDEADGSFSTIAAPLATIYGNVIFLQGSVQLIVVCTAFAMGRPFREPIYKNTSYTISIFILSFFNIFFIFYRGEFNYLFIDIYEDNDHMDYRLMIFGIYLTGILIVFLYEGLVVPFLIKLYGKCRSNKKPIYQINN